MDAQKILDTLCWAYNDQYGTNIRLVIVPANDGTEDENRL